MATGLKITCGTCGQSVRCCNGCVQPNSVRDMALALPSAAGAALRRDKVPTISHRGIKSLLQAMFFSVCLVRLTLAADVTPPAQSVDELRAQIEAHITQP